MTSGRNAAAAVAAPLPVEMRQDLIGETVESSGFSRVTDLAERFGVSTVTVRSDLAALEAVGRLRRVRGGAVPAGAITGERPLEQVAVEQEAEKALIGGYAASLVSSGDVVLLDVGSTTTAITEALIQRRDLRDVTVVTNALNVALALERAADRITVLVTGGTVRPLQHSLVNPFATLLLERLTAHLAFVGCNGVDVEGGVTNVNLAEAEIKCAMLKAARRRVVVADGTKIGEVEVARVCGLDEVDLIVTDPSADPRVVDDIMRAGTTVTVVR